MAKALTDQKKTSSATSTRTRPVVFPTLSYLNEKGKLSSACKHKIPKSDLLKAYLNMVLTRHLDERMITLQRQGTISFAMSSLGEEACITAAAAALSPEDWIFPQYREQAAIFWRGLSVEDYVHHMFCNSKDLNKGRQMPNHFGDRSLNVVTVSSPVGTQIPQSAGTAYAMKLAGDKTIALSFFGEGTASEGDFHVALNFASVRKAPVIFFCRNNGYAISTRTGKQFAADGVAPRGVGYGIHTLRVDGNDFFAVHEAVTKARAHCLSKGPVLIEAMTYRMGAHSTSDDPTAYRSKEEEEKWKAKCPLLRLRLYLESQKWWNASKQKKLEEEVKTQVDEAIAIAKKTPAPPMRSIIEDVYFEVPEELEAQLDEVRSVLGGGES